MEGLRNFWNWLIRSRKVMIALLALIQTIVFNFIPDFPQEVWIAIDAFALALIGAIAVEDAGQKIGNGRK